jgi:hypothetical protein
MATKPQMNRTLSIGSGEFRRDRANWHRVNPYICSEVMNPIGEAH